MKLPVSDDKIEDLDTPVSPATLAEMGRRIRLQRQKMSMTLDDLAAATGISKPYLSNIETARLVGPPSSEKLAHIEKALTFATGELVRLADWLRTPESIRQLMPETNNSALPRLGSGAVDLDEWLRRSGPVRTNEKSGTAKSVNPTDDDFRFPALIHVPLINRVAAGTPAEFTDLDYPAGIADQYVPAPPPNDAPAEKSPQSADPYAGMFALRVEGDSMSPQYLPGDIIVLSSVDTPSDGDDCLVRLDEHDNFATTFKRIYFVDAQGNPQSDSGHVQLCPLNPRHAKRIVAREHITSLHPAIWKITPTPRRSPAEDYCASGAANNPGKAASGKRHKRRTAPPDTRPPSNPELPPATAAQGNASPSRYIQSATQGFQIEAD